MYKLCKYFQNQSYSFNVANLRRKPKLNVSNIQKTLPIHSAVRAFGSVHPSAQEPLNASQCWFLHLFGHTGMHPG